MKDNQQMIPPSPGPHSWHFLEQASVFTDAPGKAGEAAAAGDYTTALAQADRLGLAVQQLRQAILRDALADGADWWKVAGILAVHPQQAFQTCVHLTDHRSTPAQQRPGQAVVLTAGLAADHDMSSEYGIDIEDLDSGHSLHAEPGVRRVRAAADLTGADVWIAVTIPGGFEGAQGDPAPGIDVIGQWTSVVLNPGELTWLREALVLNDAAGQDLD
jgi:hypothetical protein